MAAAPSAFRKQQGYATGSTAGGQGGQSKTKKGKGKDGNSGSKRATGHTMTGPGSHARSATSQRSSNWSWSTIADSSVSSCPPVFTKDGNYFFSIHGSAVRIYSIATGKVVSTLSPSSSGSSGSRVSEGEGHTDLITAAILNPANAFQLLTASLDGCIKVWDFLDAALLHTIDIGEPISQMCAHEQTTGYVYISTLLDNNWAKHSNDSFRHGNTMVYRVSLSRSRRAIRPRVFKPREIMRIGKTRSAVSLAVSSSGAWLIAIGETKAYVASTASLAGGFTKYVSPERLTCLAVHPTEDYFATGDVSGQIRLWYCLGAQAARSGSYGSDRRAPTTTLHWHAHAVASLAFTTNGAYIVSGGEESVLVLWQLHSGKREYVPRLGAPILSVAVRVTRNTEEEYLAGLVDGTFVFVNAASLSVSRSFARVRLDPSGLAGQTTQHRIPLAIHRSSLSVVLPSSHPSSLQVYSPSSSSLLLELEVSPSNRVSRQDENTIEQARVEIAAISDSGEWMATVDRRENEDDFSAEVSLKIWLWASSTWTLNSRINRPHGTKAITTMRFSPEQGSLQQLILMSAGLDGNVKTWSIRTLDSGTGQLEDYWILRSTLNFRSEIPADAAWSPDGSLLVVIFGPHLALYDPLTNKLLDFLTTAEVRSPESLCFMGQSGRYLLLSSSKEVALWDLVIRSSRWKYKEAVNITHVLASGVDDSVAVFSSSSPGVPTTTRVLIFRTSSPKPVFDEAVPFHLRNVVWYPGTGVSFLGVTSQWNIVSFGEDTKTSQAQEFAPRGIERSSESQPRRTLFQDIFGKSALVDTSKSPARRRDDATSSTLHQGALSVFSSPVYLAPPIETLYMSLMDSLLSRVTDSEDVKGVAPDEEDVVDMEVIIEDRDNLMPVRTVDDQEVESLSALFRSQGAPGSPMKTHTVNGFINGIHKTKANGVRPHTPEIPPTHMNGIAHSNATSTPATSRPSSPVMVGKKRKKKI